MRASNLKTKQVLIAVGLVLAVILLTVVALSLRSKPQPLREAKYQLEYRILFDETATGNELITRTVLHDYDIVFFTEQQLSQAGERVKDIARDRLAVFVGITSKKADEYILTGRIGNAASNDDKASASCYSICLGEKLISGEFHGTREGELIETISEFWHERQIELALSQGQPAL